MEEQKFDYETFKQDALDRLRNKEPGATAASYAFNQQHPFIKVVYYKE